MGLVAEKAKENLEKDLSIAKVTEKYTALYLRVSGMKQVEHGSSLQYQDEVCHQKAKELGIPDHLVKVYCESGESGEDIERPQMEQLREDIKKGLIKRVIIVHPDRLSRNMVDRLIVCAEFDKYGVELIFIDVEYKETEEGKLFFNIQSSIAQYELALIKKRTRRGSITKSKNGLIMGLNIPPFGYDYQDKKLIVNKTEAQFVKKIFQWYVFDKLTMREICERLCLQGAIPKKTSMDIQRGKIDPNKVNIVWSASSIQHIIKNETYIGKYYYNRRATKKVKGERTKSGKVKRTYDVRDKEEWIEIEVEPIIDYATFALAQEQREKNTKHSGNIKHEYLLRQKIRCGHCGNKFASYSSHSTTRSKKTGEITSKHEYRNYRCTNKTMRKMGEGVEKCSSKIIRADQLENYLWNDLIMSLLTDTDKIISAYENKYEKPSPEIEETYNLLKFKISKLEEEKKRTIQLFKKAYIDEDEMERDMKQIESGIKDLKKEKEKYENQIFEVGKNELNIEMLKSLIEKIRVSVDKQEDLTFKAKREIVDIFVDEIILKWDEEKGELIVTTVGVIDDLLKAKTFSELSTQEQTDVDTTNIVVNLVSETLFLINTEGRGTEYEMKEQLLKIS
jgi:site-specific DNA recombinase